MENKKEGAPQCANTLNREAALEYAALEKERTGNRAKKGNARPAAKNAEQKHRLGSERELMKYPNELSQLADRMADNSWQG